MTREEAIEELERLLRHWDDLENDKRCFWGYDEEAVALALTALRPVSREQVERMFPGCAKCEYEDDGEPLRIYYPDGWDNGIGFEYGKAIFCPECGKPLTDEAVQMVMERMEEMKNC